MNSDGSIDNTFKITATNKMLENASIAAVHVQNDGKILIGGSFNYVTKVANSVTYSDVGIIRLNADGTYDNKFKVDFGNTANVYAIKPSGDGKLYIGGYLNIEVVYTNGTWENFNNIVKINADGSLDKSFKWKTIYPPIPSCFAVQDDGKLLIGGGIAKVSNVPAEAYYGIVRVNKDGAIDTSFPRYGYGEVVTSLKILSDKVVFTSKNYEGKFYQKANAGIFILPKDFSFTNTFKSTQKFTYGDAYNVVEDANKNLIVVGKMYSVPVDVNPVFKGVVKLKYY